MGYVFNLYDVFDVFIVCGFVGDNESGGVSVCVDILEDDMLFVEVDLLSLCGYDG